MVSLNKTTHLTSDGVQAAGLRSVRRLLFLRKPMPSESAANTHLDVQHTAAQNVDDAIEGSVDASGTLGAQKQPGDGNNPLLEAFKARLCMEAAPRAHSHGAPVIGGNQKHAETQAGGQHSVVMWTQLEGVAAPDTTTTGGRKPQIKRAPVHQQKRDGRSSAGEHCTVTSTRLSKQYD